MSNTNTNATTNTTMYTRFCSLCGKKFETTNKLTRLCNDCREAQKKNIAKKQKMYAKKRAEALNLTTIIINREVRDKIKKYAKADNVNMSDMIAKIISVYETTTKKDNKDNVINISDKKPAVKVIKKATTKKATNKKIMPA